MCFYVDLIIPVHCTILRVVLCNWAVEKLAATELSSRWGTQQPFKSYAFVCKNQENFVATTVGREELCTLKTRPGFSCSVFGFRKQAHKWHFFLKGTRFLWCCERDQKPLCVWLPDFSALISSVCCMSRWFGLFKPKIQSVFHHDRLNCKITDEHRWNKQAAGDSSLDLSCGSRNELDQAFKGSWT